MPSNDPGGPAGSIDLSVIAPAHNERDNVEPLVRELAAALEPTGLRFEVILVDDASTDGTAEAVAALQQTRPWLRCLRLPAPARGGGNGQSAAFRAGIRAARGRLVATLDADLQNDPADLPRLVQLLELRGVDLVQGDRSADRQDRAIRRVGSVVGRLARRWLLGDTVRDTGCSLRVMSRELALRLPLEYAGLHRFIPVTARDLGYTVLETPVRHRPRVAGRTKYGLGVSRRAIPGLMDCLAVRWMRARRRVVDWEESQPEHQS